ncbi:MAG: hypothetical protein LQ338_007876 [Usnochroma carphineum]|nr:MAG: hypothetical protein LQ338_007876 [Usnochroma carphineum]
MTSTETVPSAASQHVSAPIQSRGNHRRPYRGNPARGFQQHHPSPGRPPAPNDQQTGQPTSSRGPSLAFRPSSVALPSQPSSAGPSSAENSATENTEVNRARGRANKPGRARGGRRGGAAGGRDRQTGDRDNANGRQDTDGVHGRAAGTHHPHSRHFGGRLTTSVQPTDPNSDVMSTLSPDAPEFRPGQQHQPRASRSQNIRKAPTAPRKVEAHHPRHRRDSSLKSTAPDIATRTHEDIANGLYECPICTSEIGGISKVWSCKTCWTVFHLTCIKKWSANEGSTLSQQRNQDGELPPQRQWRCPGCNLPKDDVPIHYTCWCEKELDPKSISGIPPHSCGQTCGKPRILPKKCPHPCELLCHAGPCPPCTHMGPTESCFCGKNITSKRCVDTDYTAGWSCGQICGDLMPCGAHNCQKSCHEGLCGACDTAVESRCYCGKVVNSIPCYERGDEKTSKKGTSRQDGSTSIEEWVGSFTCGEVCLRDYDCGKHRCEKNCHSQDTHPAHCPRSPDVVENCSCGRTALADISDSPRQSCTDPIPNCNRKCLKSLACGHPCQQICHSDNCMPCLLTVPITCRCGRVQTSTICHQGQEQQPQCSRPCKAILNCGRHECGERCCAGERKALERQATKRKLRPLSAPRALETDVEAEHICTRPCGRPLRCGNHACPELCHKGACGGCREAIFDEISCHCGKTVLQPPLPCGTKPPPCRFDCERPKLCGHPKVPHNCHGDDVSCPKCPYLLEKPCMCGKKLLKNQPCWLVDARCGEVCGKKLKCGSHFCRKPCHRVGECEDTGTVCRQVCGKPKKACGHPCEEQCHAPSACREDKPCSNKIFITCDCQHLKQEMKCNASRSSEGNSKKSLTCDDECARLERNRKLALALNIDPEAHKDDHIPYSTETLKLFREQSKWAQEQEREFRVFAADDAEKRLRFKPMPSHQRTFLHSLAEDFGLDSESMDPEPHRHVAVFKTPRFVMAPMKTLAECVRIRQNAEAAAASVVEAQRRLRTNNEPYSGFLLTGPRFGLTIEELRSDLSPQLQSAPGLSFEISFLPSEEVVIKAKPAIPVTNIQTSSIETAVKAMKSAVVATVSAKRLAATCQLCSLDTSLNVLRRELDNEGATDGWSRVAAKAVAPRSAPQQRGVGEKSVYTVLGSKLKDAKRKKEELEKAKAEESLADDWEEEARREELEAEITEEAHAGA